MSEGEGGGGEAISDYHLALGVFKMKWKRAESFGEEAAASVSVNLPNLKAKPLPYSLSIGKQKSDLH